MEDQDQDDFDFEAEYEELKLKHNLPDFKALAEDFDIEKIADKETIFLAREVRRAINEKVTAYIHLFETLINPTSPPMFVFKILKNMSEQEKEQIQEFYKVLSKTQIEIMKLDTVYSEKDEVKFINKTFKVWQEMKTKIYSLFASFEINFENDDISKKRSYFD
ncbi:hypothetical protein J4226_05455 [Candidatus Pacearchaeota archaeon]|nr:hypothetical protein [Candidatus Pacearchaeota archaeon]